LFKDSPAELLKQFRQGEINGKEDYVSEDLWFKEAGVQKQL